MSDCTVSRVFLGVGGAGGDLGCQKVGNRGPRPTGCAYFDSAVGVALWESLELTQCSADAQS